MSEGGDSAVIVKSHWEFFDITLPPWLDILFLFPSPLFRKIIKRYIKDGAKTKIGESSEHNLAFTFPDWGRYYVYLSVTNNYGKTDATTNCVFTGMPMKQRLIKFSQALGWILLPVFLRTLLWRIVTDVLSGLYGIVEYFKAIRRDVVNLRRAGEK